MLEELAAKVRNIRGAAGQVPIGWVITLGANTGDHVVLSLGEGLVIGLDHRKGQGREGCARMGVKTWSGVRSELAALEKANRTNQNGYDRIRSFPMAKDKRPINEVQVSTVEEVLGHWAATGTNVGGYLVIAGPVPDADALKQAVLHARLKGQLGRALQEEAERRARAYSNPEQPND